MCPRCKLIVAVALAAAWLQLGLPAHGEQQWTIRVQLQGQEIEGTPLAWSDHRVFMLARDGRLWDFPPEEATSFHKISPTFQSYSQADVRRQLLAEFGRSFDVSGTGRFLVVHPAGQRDLWAQRFEELYRSFVHYFTARGMRLRRPPFPLVAIVFRSPEELMGYAAREGVRTGAGVLGYYSAITNRIALYDQSSGRQDQTGWQENRLTIIHEAAHQSAFNTGIHNRFARPPLWVAEGLGTMFEARGVWNAHRYSQLADRINRTRLADFRYCSDKGLPKDWLARLVSSDRPFQQDAAAAYAESWALTFYLAERQPKKYFQYMVRTASREPFTVYRSPERLRDFTSVFGSNFQMLDARLRRFIQSLP